MLAAHRSWTADQMAGDASRGSILVFEAHEPAECPLPDYATLFCSVAND